MPTFDQEIARKIVESQRSGELKSAKGYGKPFDLHDAYAATPEELRMPFKILKDAGFLPPEVEMLHTISRLREQLGRAVAGSEDASQLRERLTDLQLRASIRFERLRGDGSY